MYALFLMLCVGMRALGLDHLCPEDTPEDQMSSCPAIVPEVRHGAETEEGLGRG